MTGFLKKDLYLFAGIYRKNLTLVGVLYAALYLASGMDVFLYMLIVMMGFYTLSTLTLDDASGWNRYARTLPVRTAQIIGGKYLLCLFSIGAAVIYAVVLSFIGGFFHETVFLESLTATIASATVSILFMMFLFPAAWKWGVDKARNTLLLVFAAVFGGGMFWGNHLKDSGRSLPDLAISLPTLFGLVCAAFLFVILLGYLTSFFISCHIFDKKEF